MDSEDENNWRGLEVLAIGAALAAVTAGFVYNRHRQVPDSEIRNIGQGSAVHKTVIVTGANTGVGFATARQLAVAGSTVVLACRNELLGKAAVDAIVKETGNKSVYFRQLDLTNFTSIERFVAASPECHVLINNAGGMFKEQEYVHGIEKTMFTNYVGQFLLTKLMLPVLAASSIRNNGEEVRVINIGSRSEKIATLGQQHAERKPGSSGLEVMMTGPQPYSTWPAYGNSKFCDVVSTFELHRRINRGEYSSINPTVGSGVKGKANVTVNAVTPGLCNSDLSRFANPVLLWLSAPLRFFLLKTVEQGATGIVWAALSPEVNGVSGKYFVDRKELASSAIAHSEPLGRDLWAESERLVRWVRKDSSSSRKESGS